MVPLIRPADRCGAVSAPAAGGFDALPPRREVKVRSESQWRRRARLIDELGLLRGLLERLRAAATDRAEYEPHDVTDDEAALQADAIEMRLADVVAALARIERGEYGLCRSCGSEIGDERLDVLPATEMCGTCVVSERRGVRRTGRTD